MEILAGTLKIENLICEIISALIAIILPIIIAIILKKKTKGSYKTILFGAIGFFASAMILEGIVNYFLLTMQNPVSYFINSHTWLYCLYGCLAAGFFEETGRYVVYKTLLKKERNNSVPLLYGIGHGGVESILLVGMNIIAVIALSLQMNSLGSSAVLKDLPEASATATISLVQQLFSGSPFVLLLGGLERISGIMIHLSLSVIVYKAVSCNGKSYLYPLAIIFHAIFDLPAMLYKIGSINLITTEILLLVFSSLLLFITLKMNKKTEVSK